MSDDKYIIDFDCCGVVDKWEARFYNVSGTRTVYFQVWRPVTAGSSTMELVGQNSMTVSTDGTDSVNIGQSERITVKSGDKYGWWSEGYDLITYKKGGGEKDNNLMMTLTSPSEGATLDWSGSNVENDRTYAIKMGVRDNTEPSFTNLPNTVNIIANTASGSFVYDVSVTDVDTDDISTLSVIMTANSDYSFDVTTYEVTTAATFEFSDVDLLEFVVTDQYKRGVMAIWLRCLPLNQGLLVRTLLRQRPYFFQEADSKPPTITNLPATSSISEDETIATSLFTVNVTDPEGSTTTCIIDSTTPAGAPFNIGYIDFNLERFETFTFIDKIISSDASPGFDYATSNSYTLSIECTDGQYTDSDIFIVSLVKNAEPIFLNLQNSTSISTTDTIGTNVFTVLVYDIDDVSFTMTCVPSPCPFTIFASGQIQITEDMSGHTTVGYDAYITVSDGKNTVGPKILTITVADINDPVIISNLPLTITVVENTAVGTVVFNVSYSDSDTFQAHTFSMATSGTGLTYFSISSTGLVSILTAIDYETIGTTTFPFDVTVSDPVTSDTKTLTIEVINENEEPSFSQTSYTISTSEGNAGTVIGTPPFGITDPDTDDTKTLSNECGAYTGYFVMDSSGQVSYQSDYDLDSGSLPANCNCTVTVTDSGGLTDTAILTITISDANDNPPVFSPTTYSFHVSYYASTGTSVGTVTATDADTGPYGVITYTLDQSSLSLEYFGISNTGEITVLLTPQGSDLAFGTSVTVTATASDIGARTDTASVVLIISGTTTTSTTTTTDRYRSFLEDNKNIAWLSACIAALLVCIGVLAYVIFTCHGKNGCGQFKRTFCKRKHKSFGHKRRKYSLDSIAEGSSWNKRGRLEINPRRPPPNPIRMQAWRKNMV
ncbi:cadherin-23-like [Ruditapes philippinarum]|uniref:cadherin-23-like n=1 Tax=Ruditapes philippinarum TaxID=129788 RepID=UPI00295AE395|nr:cadherin-23-like [Ruditapes philippinarum]